MERFRQAFVRAMSGAVAANPAFLPADMQQLLDGIIAPTHC